MRDDGDWLGSSGSREDCERAGEKGSVCHSGTHGIEMMKGLHWQIKTGLRSGSGTEAEVWRKPRSQKGSPGDERIVPPHEQR